jgi:hypothetical protein
MKKGSKVKKVEKNWSRVSAEENSVRFMSCHYTSAQDGDVIIPNKDFNMAKLNYLEKAVKLHLRRYYDQFELGECLLPSSLKVVCIPVLFLQM